MKISVVTAVYNRERTIGDTFDSVAKQHHTDIEHIVVDGMSSDRTGDVIAANSDRIAISVREPDDGIYDAMNKGIRVATGDVVGFLHADDMLASPTALASVADKFSSGNFDAIYADLEYVQGKNTDQVVRYWQSGEYDHQRMRWGWMPPHTTVFVRRTVYERLGGYLTEFGSAADYECMVRLMFRHKIQVGYIPEVTVKMRVGGKSNASLRNRLIANQLDRQAWRVNGLRPPMFLRISKPLQKLPQYWKRR
ncbi:PGL/p-HBAD biosynthesis glycosyltransferase [Rubripirellula obstinata]|uniref:PGL/p-HBAD biosynthesis glycosyltransferase n=1 Tax=Rubripirellula obstinata TaxID=406547 RepID=A0A5B1CJB5_9BACT|nr:glycosyltransferase family 2 protein [Rubripirellula obstinata]KAA1259829.1 PGL/p-HBAD biosynthesis glycosyltransferase [Rubripirellula obstinata]